MNKKFLLGLITFASFHIWAQNPSALVEFDSPDQGFLVPRMDSLRRVRMVRPSEGIMVYDLTKHRFYYHDGTDWQPFNVPPIAGPFVGEIRMLAGSSVPDGWLPCDGSIIYIAEYPELFAKLGIT